VGGSKNLKAVVIRGNHADRPRPADKAAFKAAQKTALAQLMDERVVTSPRKGGLSVYGTNVLMNIDSNIGGLPAATPNRPASATRPNGSAANGSRSTSWLTTRPAMPAR